MKKINEKGKFIKEKKYDFPYYDFEKFIYDYINDNEQYKNVIDYGKVFLMHIIERF